MRKIFVTGASGFIGQSLCKTLSNSNDKLKKYIEQKKLEWKIAIDQLRKDQEEPKIKFETVKKDLNCGMGFVNSFKSINQNSI